MVNLFQSRLTRDVGTAGEKLIKAEATFRKLEMDIASRLDQFDDANHQTKTACKQ